VAGSVASGGLFVQAHLFAVVMASMSASSAAADTHWQSVLAGDRKVGQIEFTRRVEGDRAIRSEKVTLELGRPGRRHSYELHIETHSTLEGLLVRVVRESKAPEGHEFVDARLVDGDLVMSIGPGPRKHTRTLRSVGELRTEEMVRRWLDDPAQPLVFRAFDSAKLAVAEIELSRPESVNGAWRVRRVSRLAGVETVTWQMLDARGNVIDERMRLGGVELRLSGATEAQARAPNEALDHVGAQLHASPYRIPNRDMRAKIRYGFAHRGRPPIIPTGAGQRSWSDDRITWIQVCASCPLDATALAEAELEQALAATPWLNYEEPALRNRALRIAGGARSPERKMQLLTDHVRELMSASRQIDMLGYGTALEAFVTRRGDCTEFAVLLAALGRAAGVPTRMVSGLVYARRFEGRRHVFVPHMWVQAWNGNAWRSFDAGIGTFDSTHLAFAVSYDGNPGDLFAGVNLAHALELRSAARVVPAARTQP
jgi:hypothetical protein